MYSHERIQVWRDFRQQIDQRQLDCNETLKEVAAFWASVPRGARSLDYYTPEDWPDPWEILSYDLFCDNTVSLLMYYTLTLLTDFRNEVGICLVDDVVGEYIAPIVDKKYLLNFAHAEVIDVEQHEVRIIQFYDNSEIKKIT